MTSNAPSAFLDGGALGVEEKPVFNDSEYDCSVRMIVLRAPVPLLVFSIIYLAKLVSEAIDDRIWMPNEKQYFSIVRTGTG